MSVATVLAVLMCNVSPASVFLGRYYFKVRGVAAWFIQAEVINFKTIGNLLSVSFVAHTVNEPDLAAIVFAYPHDSVSVAIFSILPFPAALLVHRDVLLDAFCDRVSHVELLLSSAMAPDC